MGIERRQVSVFFSDVSGYTPLSERLDPEDVRETMSEVFRRAAEIVQRYGGRIDKLLGDGVMAVFGDPVGYEDDPERAVRAVIDLHAAVDEIGSRLESRLGSVIQLHSGIASGVVLTGETGEAGSTGPVGDPVNVASRLQSLATPGQILISPETHRLTAGAFTVNDLGLREIKGKSEPMLVTEVTGIAADRTGPARVRGTFVGRQEELGVLAAAVERLRDGHAALISICAEAGAGKTRLLEEFRSQIEDDVAWIEGRAYPYGQNIPYSAVIDLLNRVLGIDEGDTSETVRTKLTGTITALVGRDDAVLAPLAWLYAIELQGAGPIDREAYQQALLGAVLRLIDVQSALQPTVLCLQDLHWADPSTVTLLRDLAASLTTPILFVCNFRPEFELGAAGERCLHLDELSGRQTGQLVSSLLGGVEPPADLTTFIGAHTDGNPFFIEEIVNRLIETGALARNNGGWELVKPLRGGEMPSTIRGVIQARIDHLDGDRRRLLREASVVGREFLYRVVSQVSSNGLDLDRGLSDLERADLIRQKAGDADLEYFFKHALTQEVAYEGLVRADRQRLHARVAAAIESLLADRAGEFVETLAFHYARAGVLSKAVHYLVESGKKSLARYALTEAGAYFAEARELLGAEEPSTERSRALARLVVEWSLVHYYQGTINEWLELLARHLADAEASADTALLAMYLGWMGNAQFLNGQLDASLSNLDRALELAREADDGDAIAYAQAWLIWSVQERGDCVAAVQIGHSMPFQPESVRRDAYPWFKSRGGLARAALTSGDLPLVRRISDELLTFARDTGNARAETFGHFMYSFYWSLTLEDDLALESARAAVSSTRDPSYGAYAAVALAGCAAAALDFDLARSIVNEWLPRAEAGGNVFGARMLQAYGGLIAIAAGDFSRGMRTTLSARSDLSRRGYRVTSLLADFALCSLRVGLARRDGPRPRLSHVLRNPWFMATEAVVAARKGRRELDRFRVELLEGGWLGALGRLDLYRAQLYAKAGDRHAAREALGEVRRFLAEQGIGGTPAVVAELEASLG